VQTKRAGVLLRVGPNLYILNTARSCSSSARGARVQSRRECRVSDSQSLLEKLHGDGRKRHCDACGMSVHAIDQYSREEWDEVWRESNGRVCGSLSGESAPEPRTRRAVLVGALLTAVSPLMAQTGRVRIRVTDATGAVITTAEGSLIRADDKPEQTAQANAAGEITLADLPLGNCRLEITATGFRKRPLTVTLRSDEEVKIETRLEVGSVGEFVIFEPASTKMSPRAAAGSVTSAEPKPPKRRRWLIFR
jgi:hypothetical protein